VPSLNRLCVVVRAKAGNSRTTAHIGAAFPICCKRLASLIRDHFACLDQVRGPWF